MLKRGFKPIVIITSGDPAGIGPEIIASIFSNNEIINRAFFFVIGDEVAFRYYLGEKINIVKKKEDYKENFLNLIPVSKIKNLKPGSPTKDTALSSYIALKKAMELIKGGFSKVLVTAPIHKKGIIEAGIKFTGHTEFLKKSSATKDVLMSFYSKKLFVGTVTTHVPLFKVSKLITYDSVKGKIEIALRFIKHYFKKANPSIAVLGLNPHAGEGGKIGHEDEAVLKPLCLSLKKEGINITGPVSADVAFYDAYNGKYDFVLGMYHDQVLAPFKMLYFDRGVNVTMGLPFIRTSPDHGTAFDIAGKGVSSKISMVNAIKLALNLAKNGGLKNEDKFWNRWF